MRLIAQLLQRHGVGLDDAGPADHVADRKARGSRQMSTNAVIQSYELIEQRGVELQRNMAGRALLQSDTALDLATREPRSDQLAHAGLERAELVGEPELDVQIAMIDRTDLDAERAERKLLGHRGVAGHAVDHPGSQQSRIRCAAQYKYIQRRRGCAQKIAHNHAPVCPAIASGTLHAPEWQKTRRAAARPHHPRLYPARRRFGA